MAAADNASTPTPRRSCAITLPLKRFIDVRCGSMVMSVGANPNEMLCPRAKTHGLERRSRHPGVPDHAVVVLVGVVTMRLSVCRTGRGPLISGDRRRQTDQDEHER